MWPFRSLCVFALTVLGAVIPTSSLIPSHRALVDRHLITGIATKDKLGHVSVRREIRDLKDNVPDQWNLYILALRALQLMDEYDPVSFYGIAGIHGKPYQPWQDATAIPQDVGKKGYCPHGNALFLAWHRPYLALYEQELYKHVQNIALQFPPKLRHKYLVAADTFRIPYWDWALGPKGGSLPDFFTFPTIYVLGVDGTKRDIPNPLYRFDFHPIIPGHFTDKWTKLNHTLRWPTSDAPDAQSQNDKFAQHFESQQRVYLDTIAEGFLRAKSLNSFGQSHLEAAHGWIHFCIGGSKPNSKYDGHMWVVEYSAFEPLFMLNHANVDRLYALWQAAHPDLWITPSKLQNGGTLALPADTLVDGNTPLAPFWKNSTAYWTVNDTRDTTTLGYAYPETQSWNFDTDGDYRFALNSSIAQMYSPSSRAQLTGTGGTAGDLHYVATDGVFVDWIINARAIPLDLPATFRLHFFLVGDFSSDPVTEVGVWANLMPENHDKEARKARKVARKTKRAVPLEMTLNGHVSLTSSLLDHITAGKLKNLDPDAVVPYLKEKLTWKVYGRDGTLVPRDELRGLAVEVVSTKVLIPDDPNQPLEYNDEDISYPEITVGKGESVKC